MKRIIIAEADAEYRRGLAEILIGDGAVPLVFEVEDDFDLDSYEGLELFNPTASVAESFKTKFADVAAWLESYRGDFPFYLSLKDQLARKGTLSDKQIASIQRAIANDQARGVATPSGVSREFSIKPGTVVVVSKFIANRIAEKAGHARAYRAFEVIEVEGETEKAYRAKVRFTARRTSHCGICGLSLENPDSIAAGVGPVCADNYGIPYGAGSLDALAGQIPDVEILAWIPKSSIKERLEPGEVPNVKE